MNLTGPSFWPVPQRHCDLHETRLLDMAPTFKDRPGNRGVGANSQRNWREGQASTRPDPRRIAYCTTARGRAGDFLDQWPRNRRAVGGWVRMNRCIYQFLDPIGQADRFFLRQEM